MGRRRGCGGRGAVAGAGTTASYRLGKLGITWSMPVSASTCSTAALVGLTSRSSPPSARARLCARTKTPQPARIAEPSAGHVHHERAVAAVGCFPQNRVQPAAVAGIDFLRRHHHGHAVDHLNGAPGASHLPPGKQTCREAALLAGDTCGPARRARLFRQPMRDRTAHQNGGPAQAVTAETPWHGPHQRRGRRSTVRAWAQLVPPPCGQRCPKEGGGTTPWARRYHEQKHVNESGHGGSGGRGAPAAVFLRL